MRIIFVCHGNICRSPMAEFIFKDLLSSAGSTSDFIISSAGVSSEESGNDIYPPAKRILKNMGIPFTSHRAHRITDSEFAESDLVIALDSSNFRNLVRRFGNNAKIRMLLDRDVEDPWYTDDFEKAFDDIYLGCKNLLSGLNSSRLLY